MKRRSFLSGMGASAVVDGVSFPALAQPSRARTLRFVPNGGLSFLDTSISTLTTTNNHGNYIYDTLYSVDSRFQAQPQMAAGHSVSDDGLTWDITLRPGLQFHDDERVLARDCVASIKRWWQRDSFGTTLAVHTNELIAVNDETLRFRLRKRFGLLPDALGHPMGAPCVIMPERLANPDPTKLVTEMIGSGPFRWLANEFVQGERAAYQKNEAYVPRQEKADGMAGGKVVYFDRAEWRTIADFGTAAAALQTGEIDWWDNVQFDLIDLLKKNRNVTVTTADAGYTNFLRFNCGTAPFNNPALRRVVASAISQTDITQAVVGDDASLQSECYAMYGCHVPGVEQVGRGLMAGQKNYKTLTEQVKKAGYNGEKILYLRVSDVFTTAPAGPVILDVLTKIGLNVELQDVDLSTLASRRISQSPVSEGGWSLFMSQTPTPFTANPVVAVVVRGLGLKGFPGNYEDPVLEGLIADWVDLPTEQERFGQVTRIQERLFEMMPIVPLGAYSMQTAFRSDLVGYLPNTCAVPWNIRRR